VALRSPLRKTRENPDGRMPLREHLQELRNRVFFSAVAVLLGAVVGWFLYEPLIEALKEPLDEVSERRGSMATLNYGDIASPFNLKLKLSLYLGIVIACPVWLYQTWAFIVPGLTGKEKRNALAFVAAAVPLFASGLTLAWFVLPNAVHFLTEFTPDGAVNIVSADAYLTFVTRIMLAFGVAFVIPLFLVAVNAVGLVSAATLAKGWRVAVFLAFLFAAIASPSPDAGSMIALAVPIVALYFIALGVACFVDRRRARRAAAALRDLPDDQARPL
jgi:sec-independent protein translocase protein TatC